MSAPLMPPPLDQVGRRRFAFYPSILNAEPNEWVISRASWSEVLVVNARTGSKISVPRHYLGGVSETDDPILIVGLTKELEYREGAVWPRIKRVIEMPIAVNEVARPFSTLAKQSAGPAPVIGIRLETAAASRTSKAFLLAGISAAVVSVLAVGVFSDWLSSNTKPLIRPVWQSSVRFTRQDDYTSVVSRLGAPLSVRTLRANAGFEFEAMSYPNRHNTVILCRKIPERMRYLGTMSAGWKIIHSVSGVEDSETERLLLSLPLF